MFNRIIVLAMGVALAVFAIWAGSALSVASIGGWNSSAEPAAGYAVATLITGVAAGIVLFFTAWMCFDTILSHEEFEDAGGGFVCSLNLVCLAYFFGEFARPSAAAANWYSPWLFLLVVGAIPMIVAAKEVLVDLFTGNHR